MIFISAAMRAHSKRARLVAALDQLRNVPPETPVTVAWAARKLGMSESRLRELVRRYGGGDLEDASRVRAVTLRSIIRRVLDPHAQTRSG